MFSMAITATDIFMVMIGFVICFVIAELAKWHVRTNCQDNPEIVWIWLDEGDEPQGGCKVKKDEPGSQLSMRTNPVPVLHGI